MEEFGFDKLPEVIQQLFEKVERIETMLSETLLQKTSDDKFLVVQDAAEYLNITVAALYSMASRRQIPVNKPGKRLYFSKTDLDEWIKAGKLKTTDEIARETETKYRSQRRV
jgi:excisionase family DNA binding protein